VCSPVCALIALLMRYRFFFNCPAKKIKIFVVVVAPPSEWRPRRPSHDPTVGGKPSRHERTKQTLKYTHTEHASAIGSSHLTGPQRGNSSCGEMSPAVRDIQYGDMKDAPSPPSGRNGSTCRAPPGPPPPSSCTTPVSEFQTEGR